MHSRERSLHHVPKLPGVGYPISGFHGRSNALCRRSTTGVNRGASMQPIGECTEITDSGCSRSTRETRERVSGSHPGDFPGEREVSRSASKMERESTGAASQFVVAKLRFRSTPSAFPRVPRATPSGLAHSTTAICSKFLSKARTARESRNVVSGSSPWIPASTRSLHFPRLG